jgi:hypothetical protein
MDALCFRLGGLSLLFRSRDLHFRDAAVVYQSFLGCDGEAPDLVADLELVSGGSSDGRTGERERLLAVVREYLEETMPPQTEQTGVIEGRIEIVRRFLSSPSFRGCLQDFEPRGGEWRSLLIGPSFVSFVGAKGSRVRLFLDGDAARTLASSLDAYVFFLMNPLLVEHQGVLWHAAGVVNGDGSYVFAGPSGAGKTTIARAAQALGWPILADDGLVVRQGTDGTFRAFRTPWRMLAPPWGGSFGEQPESAPLRAIFFVEHGTCDRWEKLDDMASAVNVMGSLFPTLRRLETGHAASAFELLVGLAETIPCYRLSFTRSCKFLREIKS